MLDIQTECPVCGGCIDVVSSEFKTMMPVYDEETLEAEKTCQRCKKATVRFEIQLKDTGAETATIAHVRVLPVVLA